MTTKEHDNETYSYEAIIKRKLQHSGMGISKFTALGPLGHYTFLYKINISRVKIYFKK